jgi:hypothetical protein
MPTPAAAALQRPRWKGMASEMADSGEILSCNARGYSLEGKNRPRPLGVTRTCRMA